MGKKIAFVIENLFNGGAERVTALLANELSYNNNVTIVLFEKNNKEYYTNDNVEKIYINNKVSGNRFVRILNRYNEIKKALDSVEPNIVISLGMVPTQYLISIIPKRRFRLILSERCDPYQIPPHGIIMQMRNSSFRRCDNIVFQTAGARDYYSKRLYKKSSIIPNPVVGSYPKWKKDNSKKRIVNFCRIDPQKNIRLLIDAYCQFDLEEPGYVLDVYGDGTERNKLEKYCLTLGISDKVVFHGNVQGVHDKIADATMFVSSSDYEGISNSMMEALAMGMPCICTDCSPGGARQIIEDGVNGLLVPVRDIKSLKEAMLLVARDENVRTKLSNNATDVINKYGIKRIAEKWIE